LSFYCRRMRICYKKRPRAYSRSFPEPYFFPWYIQKSRAQARRATWRAHTLKHLHARVLSGALCLSRSLALSLYHSLALSLDLSLLRWKVQSPPREAGVKRDEAGVKRDDSSHLRLNAKTPLPTQPAHTCVSRARTRQRTHRLQRGAPLNKGLCARFFGVR